MCAKEKNYSTKLKVFNQYSLLNDYLQTIKHIKDYWKNSVTNVIVNMKGS